MTCGTLFKSPQVYLAYISVLKRSEQLISSASSSSVSMSVNYRVEGPVAVLEADNPPVNALGHGVRLGFYNGMEKALADPKVKAVVLCGKGRTFPAGADIREFGQPGRGPWITDAGMLMEASNKPVVAAIHGTCLGGGLEISLFCHYRVAVASARVGFPEVKLGILPGAGGTQRLSRVTGLAVAMEMISSGRHVPVPEAKKYGIIDEIVTGDLVSSAMKFAMSKVGQPLNSRRLSLNDVPDKAQAKQISEAAMAQVKRKFKGFEAPIACVKTVRASAELPYDKGMEYERQLFTTLNTSGQARAQQYAFFAERVVSKWEMPRGSHRTAKGSPVRSTAVIGAGYMGSGIVVCLLSAGLPVYLVEQDEKFLQKSVQSIKSIMEGSVKLGKVSPEVGRKAATLLKPTMSYNDIKDVDLVIEAVYEDLKLKRDIFARLDQTCKPSAILCSNTSTLDIDKIASATKRPDKVAGMHFFAPAYHMRLLENIYGSQTSPETVATIMDLGKVIKKVAVLVKTCNGFLVNRMNNPSNTESTFMVEEGASPAQVDEAMENFGMLMGPFKTRDLSGIDVSYRITNEKAKALGTTINMDTKYLGGHRFSPLNIAFYEKGRYGRKTGKGWYKYDKIGGKIATPDQETEDILQAYAKRRGLERRKFGYQEIIERQVYSAINEGFKIMEEGICTRPEDIDVSWLYGLSFPKYLGGPMFYANQVGLKKVYERICYYHETFPSSYHWVPSALLRNLAEKNVSMNQWRNHVYQSKL